MITANDIHCSGFNVFGRLALAITIVGGWVWLALLVQSGSEEPMTFLLAMLAVVVLLGAILLFISLGLFFLVLYFTLVVWVFQSSGSQAIVSAFLSGWAKDLGVFIVKFIYGDWNRLDLFRRTR